MLSRSTISLPAANTGSISIFNIRGQLVDYEKLSSFRSEYTINLSKFTPGIYLVSLNVGRKTYTKKILLMR
ncbi:T9SS type A sorting domain-containing protein [bacterium]|nr:T9SS type A sorting domain-containing protein [bacterium]